MNVSSLRSAHAYGLQAGPLGQEVARGENRYKGVAPPEQKFPDSPIRRPQTEAPLDSPSRRPSPCLQHPPVAGSRGLAQVLGRMGGQQVQKGPFGHRGLHTAHCTPALGMTSSGSQAWAQSASCRVQGGRLPVCPSSLLPEGGGGRGDGLRASPKG